MTLTIRSAQPNEYTAHYAIMALAGEHMHRVLGLSHWHPFLSSVQFTERVAGREVFGVYSEALLVGTFNISTLPEPYYLDDMSTFWQDAAAPAMYFSAFALLPTFQQQGIGSWCMRQMDAMVQARGYQYVRFDAVFQHKKLLHFYTRLGYQPCGELTVREGVSVMCFEKAFPT